jgi:hypothetical protein
MSSHKPFLYEVVTVDLSFYVASHTLIKPASKTWSVIEVNTLNSVAPCCAWSSNCDLIVNSVIALQLLACSDWTGVINETHSVWLIAWG